MRFALLVLVSLLALSGCALDGEAGVTTLGIVNESDQTLTYTYESGIFGEPRELATEIAPSAATDILRSSGCIGCSDPPHDIAPRLTIARASDGAVVLDLNPATYADWTGSDTTPTGGGYDAHYTITLTQAAVEAAAP